MLDRAQFVPSSLSSVVFEVCLSANLAFTVVAQVTDVSLDEQSEQFLDQVPVLMRITSDGTKVHISHKHPLTLIAGASATFISPFDHRTHQKKVRNFVCRHLTSCSELSRDLSDVS